MLDRRCLVVPILLTALACNQPAPPSTAATPLVAFCEAEHVDTPIDPDPSFAYHGLQIDASGDRAVIARGNELVARAWGFHRDGGGWMPDGPLALASPDCAVNDVAPCATAHHVAIDGDLAVVGYLRKDAANFGAYAVVVELQRATPTGFESLDVDIVEVGTVAPASERPVVWVASDGGDVVVSVSRYLDLSSTQIDGYALAYRIGDVNGAPALTELQMLPAPSPSPGYGASVTVRDGWVAVGQIMAAGPSAVVFFRRDGTGTFVFDALATLPANPQPRKVFAAIVDGDHAVISVASLLGQAPITLYERAGGGAGNTLVPVSDLPVDPNCNTPRASSIDASGERVAIAGYCGPPGSAMRWLAVFRWHPGSETFTSELSRVMVSNDELGGVAALADSFLIVGHSVEAWDTSPIDAWPFEELVANDDEYSVDPPTPLTEPAVTGVIANDKLHCLDADAILDLAPAHGTVELADDGGFIYTPDEVSPVACGDKFSYHLEKGDHTSDPAVVRLDFRNPLCRRFHWAAYDRAPYIYMGCPEPGPEPWGIVPTIVAQPGNAIVDVELASAVALDVVVTSPPSNGTIVPSSHGFAFVPATAIGPTTSRVALRVSHGACTYQLEAELVISR